MLTQERTKAKASISVDHKLEVGRTEMRFPDRRGCSGDDPRSASVKISGNTIKGR